MVTVHRPVKACPLFIHSRKRKREGRTEEDIYDGKEEKIREGRSQEEATK
jgi:hypothetical protein